MSSVLFVDDDPEIISSTRRLLYTLDFDWQVTFAQSANEAIQRLAGKSYDVVISDIRMPGVSGIDLLDYVRKNSPQTVRIAFSGQTDHEASLKISGLAHRYLVKPSPIETVVTAIQQSLVTGSLIKDEKLRNLVAQIKALPSQPEAYLQIVSELKKPEPSTGKISKIISQDMGMAAKILQLVNSAFFALPQSVIDPAQAAVLLGVDTIRDLVLSIGIFAQFDPSKLQRLSLSSVWNHSQRVAGIAKAIVTDLQGDKKQINNAFVSGLLHDVGKLILADNYPDPYIEVQRRAILENKEPALIERQYFGCTHAQVGAYLFGIWGLPPDVVNAVAAHHQPASIFGNEWLVPLALHVANVLDYQVKPERSKSGGRPALDPAFLSAHQIDAARLERWQNVAVSLNA